MNRSLLSILALAFAAPALLALDGPALPSASGNGTPRTFTETERAKVDKYLAKFHDGIATSFGEQMGFGLDRVEPLMLFHWINQSDMDFDLELLGQLNAAAPVVYKNPLPTGKGEEQLKREFYSFSVGGKPKLSLPTAEQFKNAPARALLPIEESALKLLKNGAPLHWEQIGNDVRVVGALSAKKGCVECHQVKEHTLLGAITYRFETSKLLKWVKRAEEIEAEDKNDKNTSKTDNK